jgi:hypothetical protein
MEMIQDIVDTVVANPGLAIVAAAAVAIIIVLRWGRGGGAAQWARLITALQKRYIRAVHEKRIPEGGTLHGLMGPTMTQWPHNPAAFYMASLRASEEIAQRGERLADLPEAQANQTVQEIAAEFENLSRLLMTHPKALRLVPKAQRTTAKRARGETLKRLRG